MKNIFLFGAILIIIAGSFYAYSVSATYKPSEYAISKLTDEKLDIVSDNQMISFTNKTQKSERGVIIYPGGYIDPISYAPFCNEIALKGVTCVIAKFPMNLAIFGINRVEDIMPWFPYVSRWYVGGHSLGGPMLSRFVQKYQGDRIMGIFFLASYTDVDISNKEIGCVTITGSLDNIIQTDKYENGVNNLPKDCKRVEIKGGNHSQFGSYGLQNGDNEATTTFEQQLFETIEEVLSL